MGKGGQLTRGAVVAAARDETVLIEGELYDVSDFRHPGGSIVKFLTGAGDATEAFKEFHGRSKKAKAMLKALPHKKATNAEMKARGFNGEEAMSKDFAKLRSDLEAEGFFESSPSEVFYRLSEIVVMHVLGLYLLMKTPYYFASITILGIVSGRCGWLMHEGGHYSLTANIAVDKFLQEVLYGVGCGMSAAWWRVQHNKHHAAPQKLKHDVDLDTLPLVAFNAKIAEDAEGVVKFWLKLQGVLFIPVSCFLVALGWQYFLHPRYVLRAKKYREAFFIILRNLLIFGVVLKGYSWPAALVTYFLYGQIASSYIFTNFALSHSHLPVTEPTKYLNWTEYAAKHTTNIAPNFLINWWMAYLNFQIEHHLFPSMPQFRHRTIAPRVKALFEKHGLPYDVRPYFSCLGETLWNLHVVGNDSHAKVE